MIHESTMRPILLVEDNPVDLDLTLRAFKQRNLSTPIQIARDGQEALDWIPRWEAVETIHPRQFQVQRYHQRHGL
ncbi:MAG: hypothetical protein KJ702_15535, partial [Gammaproteobacteria bacterium]|nr:hypothetical protein [Gammaproteobacteria bacterium]